jgi:hypothetical protein
MKNKYVRFYTDSKVGDINFRKYHEGIVAHQDFIEDGEVFHILGLTVPMSHVELVADVTAKPNLVLEAPVKRTVKETEADRHINNFKGLIDARLIKVHEAIREMKRARACFDPDTYLDRFNEIAEFSLSAYKVFAKNEEYSAASDVSQRFVGSSMSICLDIYDAPTRAQLKRMLTRK